MKTLFLPMIFSAALALTLGTGCYVHNNHPNTGRDAPVEEPVEGGEAQPGEGEEGEVPPPAPGSEEGYGDGQDEGHVPVDPGPTW